MARGSVALHLRTVARTRWRSVAAVALLFGLTGGLASASWASARRTDSAYDRFLVDTDATELSVDYGAYDADIARQLDQLPGVIASSSYVALNTAPWDAERGPDLDATFETVGSLDGRYFEQDRVAVVRGRLPDPGRADEVAINEITSEVTGIEVGDRLTLGVVSDEDLEGTDDPSTLTPRGLEDVVVVGEVVFGDEVIQDDNDVTARLLTTPPFTAKFAELGGYAWQGLALRPGADADAVTTEVRRVVGAAVASDEGGGFVLVRGTGEDRARIERAIVPQVSALLIAAALVAAVSMVLVTQASGRLVRSAEPELRTYRAVGATERQLVLLGVVPSQVAIAGGMAVALLFAVAVSPLSPFGALHRIDPSPGIELDLLAVVVGTMALAAATAIGAGVAAVVASRRMRADATVRTPRASRAVAILQRAGAPPSVTAGARSAFVPTPGRGSAPIRSITIGTIVATAALVASLCFGASLNRLIDEPRLYGWNWDIAIMDDGGYGDLDRDALDAALATQADVVGWTGVGLTSTPVDGRTVPLVGFDAGGDVEPTVLEGRGPRNDREIALGQRTMQRLGVAPGDSVSYGPDRRPLTVVGTVSLPAIGQVHSSHPSPGEGGLVTLNTLFSALGDAEGVPSGMTMAAVDLRPGTDVEAAIDGGQREVGTVGSYPGSAGVIGVPRPAEIVNAGSVTAAPTLMAAVLMATALISLGLALVGNVRRRRDELAVLRALGFTRGQLVTSVVTQSIIVVTLGVLLGVPIGILLGRASWSAFADQLSVLDRPVVPVVALVVALAVIVAIALLASIVPARLATRVRVIDRRATV